MNSRCTAGRKILKNREWSMVNRERFAHFELLFTTFAPPNSRDWQLPIADCLQARASKLSVPFTFAVTLFNNRNALLIYVR